MDGFLKIVGMTTFVLALGAVVLLAVNTKGIGVMALVYALPIMVGGAATYALGAILNNLIAIRASSEKQADALGNLVAMQLRAMKPPAERS
ncbi:MAG: hypothetical protein H5U22_10750 [Rhizobium sp.]|nr:hypothetical protein [Rhizobium sp.]